MACNSGVVVTLSLSFSFVIRHAAIVNGQQIDTTGGLFGKTKFKPCKCRLPVVDVTRHDAPRWRSIDLESQWTGKRFPIFSIRISRWVLGRASCRHVDQTNERTSCHLIIAHIDTATLRRLRLLPHLPHFPLVTKIWRIEIGLYPKVRLNLLPYWKMCAIFRTHDKFVSNILDNHF